ncbi:MAG: LysR family transcriptional regulator [Dorea sp.]|nr:LysR family transcriptional regulator [Dorea sp.]
MNLKQLEAFVKVVETGSFSKAAKELYLTQPTVSAHISALEKELKVRLFIRNTKEVTMSDAGQDLYKYAKQMFELECQIAEHFNIRGRNSSNHSITIAASTIPAQYLLPDVLMMFKKLYPKEQFKLIETDSSQVVSHIVDGMADVGFTGTVLEKKYCRYIPFYKDKLSIITPNTEKYRALQEDGGDEIFWLKGEHVILREEGSGTRKEAQKQLKKAGIDMGELDIIASIDNQETIKRSVRQGMGVSILSRLATEEEVQEGHMLAFPIPKSDAGRDINLVYNKNTPMTANVERFIKIIKDIYNI